MELTFRTAGIGDLELLTESRLRAIRTYRHLSETAALPHGLPDAVRDYYRQALASGSHIALLALAGERLAATGGLDLRREMPSYHNPAGLFDGFSPHHRHGPPAVSAVWLHRHG